MIFKLQIHKGQPRRLAVIYIVDYMQSGTSKRNEREVMQVFLSWKKETFAWCWCRRGKEGERVLRKERERDGERTASFLGFGLFMYLFLSFSNLKIRCMELKEAEPIVKFVWTDSVSVHTQLSSTTSLSHSNIDLCWDPCKHESLTFLSQPIINILCPFHFIYYLIFLYTD